MTANNLCKISIRDIGSAERAELTAEYGEDPGYLLTWHIQYLNPKFLDHVDAHLPHLGIKNARNVGAPFDRCGDFYRTKEEAEAAALKHIDDLLDQLEQLGHPWIPF